MGCLRMAYFKLFTKEDPNRIHKILGFSSLASFVYRYAYVAPRYGSLGLGNDFWSWFTLLLHLFLSTSSLIFHVLPKRIINRPMIIWEEYRLHAIVFTTRCFSVWCFHWFRPQSIHGQEAEYFLLYSLVMIHHVIVDKITVLYGTPGQTAVRVQDSTDNMALYYAKRFYGFYQFTALGSHLIPHHDSLGEMGFNAMIAIQSSAFLMTLFRKGLIKWYSHAGWYTLCLVLSQLQMYRVFGAIFFVKVAAMFILRTRFRLSKYFIWALFSISHTPGVQNLLSQSPTLSSYDWSLSASNLDFKNMNFNLKNMDFDMDFKGFELQGIFDFTLTNRAMLFFGMMFLGFTANTMGKSSFSKLAERPLAYAIETKEKYVGTIGKKLRAKAAIIVPEQVQASWDSMTMRMQNVIGKSKDKTK